MCHRDIVSFSTQKHLRKDLSGGRDHKHLLLNTTMANKMLRCWRLSSSGQSTATMNFAKKGRPHRTTWKGRVVVSHVRIPACTTHRSVIAHVHSIKTNLFHAMLHRVVAPLSTDCDTRPVHPRRSQCGAKQQTSQYTHTLTSSIAGSPHGPHGQSRKRPLNDPHWPTVSVLL